MKLTRVKSILVSIALSGGKGISNGLNLKSNGHMSFLHEIFQNFHFVMCSE